MEPRIHYPETADGVGITFWTLGKGMTLVVMLMNPRGRIQRSGGSR